MITLATLGQATAQEVFDQIANHLITQKVGAFNNQNGCDYRTKDGLKCAAGCLISDEEYLANSERYEGEYWGDLVRMGRVPVEHEQLIISLQRVHDSKWSRNKLKQVAKAFKLKTKILTPKH